MAFDWSWKGLLINAAQQGMEGYNPNVSNAAAQMQGYAPTPVIDAGTQGGAVDRGNAMQVSQQQAMQELAANRNAQRIEQIKAQIAELENRIATNTAKLKNFIGSGDKIAAIEARKFFSQDPTSIWRWKQGMDAQKAQHAEDMARLEAEKQKNKAEQKLHVQNKLNSYLPTMAISLSTSPEQAQQYLNTLAGLETEANNYGIDDPRIAEMKARLSGDLPYNQMMAAIDELEDIDANFGKGPDYDRMNDAQKFEVYEKKLEDAKNAIIANYPELWQMMDRDRRYSKKLATLLANRKPKSKGTPPTRPSTRK